MISYVSHFQTNFIYGLVADVSCVKLGLTDDKPTLVQVMAWRRESTSHHLSQC